MIPVCLLSLFLASDPTSIRRLDGSKISIQQADVFARKTLAEAHVTGAQLVVLNNGRLVWSASYGFRRRDPALPMDRETTTWAASITKSVFSTYVMQLVERGEFDLDKPIAKQLPQSLDSYEVYRSTASELVKDPRWASITPRMLLAHSSGLQNFSTMEPDKKMHLHSDPGTKFLYSGEGINLVQFVIEQQKQKTLDILLQDALFTPLGMTRTGIIYRKEFEANVADRYDSAEAFRSKTQRFPARAAGSMTTSAEDLARFLSALFDNKILKPAIFRAMLNPFMKLNSLHEFPSLETVEIALIYQQLWDRSRKRRPDCHTAGRDGGFSRQTRFDLRSLKNMGTATAWQQNFRNLFSKTRVLHDSAHQ